MLMRCNVLFCYDLTQHNVRKILVIFWWWWWCSARLCIQSVGIWCTNQYASSSTSLMFALVNARLGSENPTRCLQWNIIAGWRKINWMKITQGVYRWKVFVSKQEFRRHSVYKRVIASCTAKVHSTLHEKLTSLIDTHFLSKRFHLTIPKVYNHPKYFLTL